MNHDYQSPPPRVYHHYYHGVDKDKFPLAGVVVLLAVGFLGIAALQEQAPSTINTLQGRNINNPVTDKLIKARENMCEFIPCNESKG